jgi:hypothetical protein
MFGLLFVVKKAKNPRLTGNRGFLVNLSVHHRFTPAMPKERDCCVSIAIQPLTGAYISLTIVLCILTWFKPI